MSDPAPAPDPQARALRRVVNLAETSGMSLLVLGGISTAFNLLHPLSASFLMSVAAVANGVVEWRGARRLRARDTGALRMLAVNQLALGIEILAYGLWQAAHVLPESIVALLQRPYLRPLLNLFPPENVQLLGELLPLIVRPLYAAVGVGGALGAWAVAVYYATRRKHL